MGTRTSYAPGTFSWVDLATTDVDAAKAFYTALLGWTVDDNDAGGRVYTTLRLDGDAVAGLSALPDDQRASGVPPSWTSYVTVDDADAAAARAEELGGKAIAALDVLDMGRMAVLADPQGAVFAVWQPRSTIGAERVNDLGCLCINELATSDLGAARSYYERLFGWTTETVDTGPGGPAIVSVKNRDTLNASFSEARPGEPPNWRPYFTVTSVADTVARVRELGGDVLLEPLPVGEGTIAIATDPQGAVVAFFEGPVDP